MIAIPVRPRAVGLNLTPLIDVVFLLLVYFLLTAHFIEEEGIGVRLPTAASTAERAEREIVVGVGRSGELFVGGAVVSLEGLRTHLRRAVTRGETRVVIRGDRDAALQAVVSVMEAAKLVGADRIVVATVRGEPPL